MRRPRRLGLIVSVLVIAFAIYSVVWWIVAGRIEAAISQWAEAARAQRIALSWQGLQVAGYPFAFRIELTGAHLRDDAANPAAALGAPLLSASAAPWSLRDWALSAPAGIDAALGPDGEPLATLSAGTAAGTVAVAGSGGVAIWLRLTGARGAASGSAVAAEDAQFWVDLPAEPPRSHRDRAVAFAADLRLVSFPQAPKPLGGTIDDVAFGAAVLGPIPSGVPRQAAAAWRDGGGTVELDHVDLSWGPLEIAASGTLALDRDLQPVGSFSGTVSGYDVLLAALADAGQIRPGDARLARLALGMMARPGPYDRPQIATSLSIQNGALFLGPARLGPVPRVSW